MLLHSEAAGSAVSCSQCGRAFRHVSTLRKHLARVHEFKPEQRLRCEECGGEYNHREGLRRHIRKAHGGEAAKQVP